MRNFFKEIKYKWIDFLRQYKMLRRQEAAFKWLNKHYRRKIHGDEYCHFIYLNKDYPSTIIHPVKTVLKAMEALGMREECRVESISFKFLPYDIKNEKKIFSLRREMKAKMNELSSLEFDSSEYKNCMNEYKEIEKNLIELMSHNNIIISLKTWRPGMVIGKSGKRIDALNMLLKKYFSMPVTINIREKKESNGDLNVVSTFAF